MVFLNVNDEPFVIYKNCLSVVGIWPENRYKWGSLIMFSITVLLQTTVITTRLIDPYGKCRPYKIGKPEFEVTAYLIIALGAQLTLRFYGGRMISLIESTIDDWSSIVDAQSREIMKRHNKCGTYIWTFRFLYLFFRPIVINILPLLYGFKSSDRYVDRRICAFDEDYKWRNAIGVILTITAGIFSGITLCGGNLLFWSLAMHLSSQYKILKRRFKDCLLIWDEIGKRRKFRRLVDRHNKILDLCQDLQDSYTVYVPLQVFGSQLTVCLSAMQFVTLMRTGEYTRLPILLMNTATILLVSFLYCYAGDYLTASCEEIGHIFVQCKWYELSKDSITNYSIVTARSRMPKTLTVIKFYTLNLSNFKTILQAVYSYISLLAAVTSDKK